MELLSPAGRWEAMEAAVQNGADAVYLGCGPFNARRGAENFTPEQLPEAVRYCHLRGVKVYLTVNTLLSDRELPQAEELLRLASRCGVDGVIVQDWGLAALARKAVPDLPLHGSTQMTVHTLAGAEEAARLGMRCVVLGRELSREDAAFICRNSPIAAEVFAHGALCMCWSGQCAMSALIGRRSGNRGACAQPCRYQYALMEEKRPGEYFPVYEENGETYIMNSRDMCMIDHVAELMEAGVDSIKLEGRAKSAYYAAIVTGAYRHAIDAAAAGVPLDPVWRDEVEHISHRHYSTGFFYGQPGQFTDDARYVRDWQIVAKVRSCDGEGNAVLTLNNKFAVGDALELVGPDVRPRALTVDALWDGDGEPLEEVRRPQMVFRMKLPCSVPPLSLLRRKADLSP